MKVIGIGLAVMYIGFALIDKFSGNQRDEAIDLLWAIVMLMLAQL